MACRVEQVPGGMMTSATTVLLASGKGGSMHLTSAEQGVMAPRDHRRSPADRLLARRCARSKS